MQEQAAENSRDAGDAPGLGEMEIPGAGTGSGKQKGRKRRTRCRQERYIRPRSDAYRAELAIFAGMTKERTYVDARLGQVTVRKSRQARRISIRVAPVKGVVVTIPSWVPYRVGEAFLMSRRDWAEQALLRMADRVKEALEQGIPTSGTEKDALGQGTMSLGTEKDAMGQGTMILGTEKDALEQSTMIPGSEMMPREMVDAGPTDVEKDVTKGKDAAKEMDAKKDLDAQIEQWRKLAKTTLPARLAELAGKYGFRYGRVTIKHNRSNWGSCSAKGNINLNLNLVRLPRELQDYVILHELCHLRYMDHGTLFHGLLEDLCRQEGLGAHEKLRKQLKGYLLL